MIKNYFKYILIIIALSLIATIFILSKNNKQTEKPNTDNSISFDSKNFTLKLDNQTFTLVNGIAQKPISPISTTTLTTIKYFGNDSVGDINGDGSNDTVFIVTQDNGGSGLFYYAIAAINTGGGYIVTNPFFIGDRISPQSTEIHSDSKEIHINFAERNEGEPMMTKPSLGAVLLLKVTNNNVLEGLMK